MTDNGVTVRDNSERSHYEIVVRGDVAGFAAYHDQDGARVFMHTAVDDDYEGQGLGTVLARAALDDTRAKGLSVVPRCPFIKQYIARHPEYQDLVKH